MQLLRFKWIGDEIMDSKVSVVMGSISDWETMKNATQILDELNVSYEKRIISAHRMSAEMIEYAQNASKEDIKVIIAGAGGAAHLPGMIAANTLVPVIGVPIKTSSLNGMDSLLSIVQMPAGIPVATTAIGKAGAKNAALLAAQILGLNDVKIQKAVNGFRKKQHDQAVESNAKLK